MADGLGGNAGMDAARTDRLNAPVVVGTPLKGPCEVVPVVSGLTTGGGGTDATGDAGTET